MDGKFDYGDEADKTIDLGEVSENPMDGRRETPFAHDDSTQPILSPETGAFSPMHEARSIHKASFGSNNSYWRSAFIGFLSGIIGGAIVLSAFVGYSALQPQPTPSIQGFDSNRPVVVARQQKGKLLAPQEIYDRFGPAVVQVRAEITEYGYDLFGRRIPNSGQSEGSGFVIDSAGYIVTNAHVVYGADRVSVTLADKTVFVGNVVGVDESSDLALIKVNPGKKNLSVINLADSSAVRVGDTVYAIGNPFGHLEGSMSSGIVSGVGRQIQAPNNFTIRNVIQTDAAVNPGNSGGPLIDVYGQVIGVNSQIEANSSAEQFAGIAYAIPSNTVRNIVDALKGSGKASHAWIGIGGQDITPDFSAKHQVQVKTGIVITEVKTGSPAEKAGLRGLKENAAGRIIIGDVLVEFNGYKVASMDDLLSLVEKEKVGNKVKIIVIRDGKRKTFNVTLGERPENLG